MKTFLITAIAILLFCGSTIAQTDEVSMRVGQQKSARSSKVRIKFLSVVEDSRCPKDVNCVWAGNAKIKVRISTGRTSREVEINTNTGAQGSQIEAWAINLVSLTPSPTSKGAPSGRSYRANFTVTRLQR